jgi:hypothetical protein
VRLPCVLILAALSLALPASAAERLSGEEIHALVADKTITGTMVETGDYAEFYAADGTIRGEGYQGLWTVEGDAMCFDYGDDPAACWGVAVEEGEVLWLTDDGAIDGTGTLTEGNSHNY